MMEKWCYDVNDVPEEAQMQESVRQVLPILDSCLEEFAARHKLVLSRGVQSYPDRLPNPPSRLARYTITTRTGCLFLFVDSQTVLTVDVGRRSHTLEKDGWAPNVSYSSAALELVAYPGEKVLTYQALPSAETLSAWFRAELDTLYQSFWLSGKMPAGHRP